VSLPLAVKEMKIGIAGPMSLRLLNFDFSRNENVPVGYDHPPISMLINALLTRGHEVVAFTTSPGIHRPVVYEGKNLTICVGRRENHAARDLFRSERKDLVQLMRDHPADLINAQWSYEFAWAALDAGFPTLITVRDNATTVFRYQTDPYRFMRMIMNFIVLNRAPHLAANSRYLYDRLPARNKRKARIVPNFYSSVLEARVAQVVVKSNFILSVSNGFGRIKNIDTALKAFSLLRKEGVKVEYHLVGDGMEEGGSAHQYAHNNGLAEGVRFIGKMPFYNITTKMKQALIMLHPSREESFGMSVLEAMAMGTPVVGGSRSGNIPYLLDGGRAGLLCDVNSPDQIAKGLLRVLSDEEYARSLSQAAKQFARENFSEDVVIHQYTDYYRDILN
jgi:glycosyltransferase involved in cell wall biosynthesis